MGADTDVRTGAAINFSALPWVDMTNVEDSFALPDSSAGLNLSGINGAPLVAAAHAGFSRCDLVVGGATASLSNFATDTSSANVAKFVASITNTVRADSYDGVDIDWEFPTAAQKTTNFMPFMQALYAAVKSMPPAYDGGLRDLTLFVSAGGAICGEDWATLGNYCDAGIMSGYDYYTDSFNGPLSDPSGPTYTNCAGQKPKPDIKSSFAMLTTSGMAPSKLALGCPLYSESSTSQVPYILAQEYYVPGSYLFYTPQQEYSNNYSGPVSAGNWSDGVAYGDDSQSFCAKINWVLANGLQGIGLWEISYAYPPTDNLVTSVWADIGGGAACLSVASPTPTFTSTPSATPSATMTWTDASITPTFTFTATATATAITTATATAMSSVDGTQSPSPTTTPTSSPSDTIGPDQTPSPWFSPSPVVSGTRTVSPSPTATVGTVPTAVSTSTAGTVGFAREPSVVTAQAVPNPVSGPHWRLSVLLSGPAASFKVSVYTVAEVLVGAPQRVVGPWVGAWNTVCVPAPSAAPGLYYVRIQACEGDFCETGKLAKLYYLP